MGYSIYYAENMETIGDNLKEVQPHLFNTVPRLLEKVYDKIVAKGYELTGVKKKLFFWALELGLRNDPAADMGGWYDFQLKIANKLIFSKWREALGGNIQQINSGASALQPRLARVFWAAGIRVCEGYGLTETSPVVTASIGMKEDEFTLKTHTLTIGFSAVLAKSNPNMTFSYISGSATDSTEKGAVMWARVKGKTENDLAKLGFKALIAGTLASYLSATLAGLLL
jgi:hypothetical protein